MRNDVHVYTKCIMDFEQDAAFIACIHVHAVGLDRRGYIQTTYLRYYIGV